MFISKTLLSNLNLPLPTDTWTWDDYTDLARKATRTGEAPTWGTYGIVHWPTIDVWLHRGGGGNWDNKGNSMLDKPETLAGLQFIQDLFIRHNVVPLDDKKMYVDARTTFFNGQLAFWYLGPHARAWMIDPTRNTGKIDWDQVEMPVRQAGVKTDIPSGTGMNAIWSTSKHVDEAYQLVRWFSQLQGQMLHMSSGGWPVLKQALNDPSFLKWENKNNKFITERIAAPGNRDFPGGQQFERWLGGDTADDPNAAKLLEDFTYGRVSAKEFVDRAHPTAKRLREKYENAT